MIVLLLNKLPSVKKRELQLREQKLKQRLRKRLPEIRPRPRKRQGEKRRNLRERQNMLLNLPHKNNKLNLLLIRPLPKHWKSSKLHLKPKWPLLKRRDKERRN
jgi:hypothetical protein